MNFELFELDRFGYTKFSNQELHNENYTTSRNQYEILRSQPQNQILIKYSIQLGNTLLLLNIKGNIAVFGQAFIAFAIELLERLSISIFIVGLSRKIPRIGHYYRSTCKT